MGSAAWAHADVGHGVERRSIMQGARADGALGMAMVLTKRCNGRIPRFTASRSRAARFCTVIE